MGKEVGEQIHIYFHATVLSLLLIERGVSFLDFHELQIMQKKKKIKRQEARERRE